MKLALSTRKNQSKNAAFPALLPTIKACTQHYSAEPRCQVSFVPDTSGSMTEVASQITYCVDTSLQSLKRTASIGRRVDLEIITAGGTANLLVPFTCVLEVETPQLSVGGGTPLGEAAQMALRSIQNRVKTLRAAETEVVSSILVIISDGEANDIAFIQQAKQLLREAPNQNITVIPFLTAGGNGAALRDFCGCDYLDASTTDIPELFRKLTAAIRVVSQTAPSQINNSFVRNLIFRGDDE